MSRYFQPRIKSIVTTFLLVSLLGFSHATETWAARKKNPPAGCRAIILSNATKAKRYYAKNASMRILPASTTKVMTALLVMQKLDLNAYVTVSNRATFVQPSKIHIRPGERYRVRDLLYATLLSSANDASVALAEAVAGSEWEFVKMMNQKAVSIGAQNTRFANSNGLPTKRSTQYTTAFDMYVIFREALKYPFFREAIQLKYKTIQNSVGRQIALKSHNKMLFNNWAKKVYGKTGYTHSAGACFVGMVNKGNDTLIVGVFGCRDRWEVIHRVVTQYGGVRL